ncbi:MAG: hypothetical protein LBU09_03255, partial [Endomicrobium sp.]|nr:hypothetical protein [Endomicrobium sp.]
MINLQKIPKNWSITFEEFCQNNGITDFSFLSKAQKKRLLDFKYMFRKRQRDYGILYYRAQPYQQAFHKSAKKIRLVLGGNQTGKTEVGIAEDVRTALNIDPFDKFSGDKYPLRLRLIATDIKKGIGEVFMPKLQKLLPQEQIARIEKYQTGQWSKIFLKNEST